MENKLNLQELEKYLLSIFKDKDKLKQIVIGQYCRQQGFVERIAGVDLKLCNDPECGSCSMIHKEIKKITDDTSKNYSRQYRSKRK